jgi:hypothetical protein
MTACGIRDPYQGIPIAAIEQIDGVRTISARGRQGHDMVCIKKGGDARRQIAVHLMTSSVVVVLARRRRKARDPRRLPFSRSLLWSSGNAVTGPSAAPHRYTGSPRRSLPRLMTLHRPTSPVLPPHDDVILDHMSRHRILILIKNVGECRTSRPRRISCVQGAIELTFVKDSRGTSPINSDDGR